MKTKKNGKVEDLNVKETGVSYNAETKEGAPETPVSQPPAPETNVEQVTAAKPDEKKAGAKKPAVNKGKGAKAIAKANTSDNNNGTGKKVLPFEKKPIPEAVRGIVESIQAVKNLDNLKVIAREIKKHWKVVHMEISKKAVKDLKPEDPVWFRKGAKVITGKVVKVKSNGKVKINADGEIWRVSGTLIHNGEPTGEDRAQKGEKDGGEVTKKAA